MNSKEEFFDKLETYFDFRDSKPEDFSPIALENLARDLVQFCGAVRRMPDRVGDGMHRAMISVIVGEESPSVKEWGRGGYLLNEGARLLSCTLTEKFGVGQTA